MTRLARLPVWVAMVLCLVTGCAAHHRENYLKDRAAEHVYRQPLSEIWPRVKAVLDDKGYYYEELPGSFFLQTDWKQAEGSGSLGDSYTRYLIEGTELKGGGVSLHVVRNDASSRYVAVSPSGRRSGPLTGTEAAMVDASHRDVTIQRELMRHSDRDLQMEWELLQVIDPEAAAALEKDAQAKFPK
jgi:hypothetical protein